MDSRVLVILLATLFLLPTDVTLSQELNGSTAVSSQELLPASTKAWLSIPDSKRLDEKFLETQMGKLAQDEKFAPFMEGLKAQFRGWMNDKNVRLGLDIGDVQDIRSGEICIAGILPAQAQGAEKLGRGSHGMVVLVDVSDNLDEANDLMDKVGKDLIQRGATKEDYEDVFGAEVAKWKFPRKNELEVQRFAYQTISNGWLLSSDNEIIFRKIVRRLVNIDNAVAGESTLASQVAFQNVMDTVKLNGIEPEIYWYVNPFGYIQLAQAIAREREEFRQANNDDWARILKKIGFDGFKGVGGYIAFATGQHELLHRTYVYKPTSEEQEAKQKRVFGLFDFENKKKSSLAPPAFVSDSVSGYFCAAWNMQRALKNVGYVIDTFVKKQGTLEDTLENLRVEMNVDVPDVISKFDNEIMVISETTMPVAEGSERLSIAIRSIADPNETIETIKRSWPHQHKVSEFNGFKIVNIDDSIGADELDFEEGIFGDDLDEEEEEEAEPQFSVFENRFCSATEDFMFVANNEDELKKILSGDAKSPLAQSQDYLRVSEALGQFSDDSRISFRQFSRLDRVIRPNYEMMKAGKMAASDTVLARLMNYMFATRNKNADAPRKQKIDGSTLPSDFEKDVAPYFGPSGWVMETTQDGWLISGVVLERTEVANQVVKKEDVSSQNR